jgi:phosphoglucosamine mutase
MVRLFGTDGIRGLANGDLTAELALDVSWQPPMCFASVPPAGVRALSSAATRERRVSSSAPP